MIYPILDEITLDPIEEDMKPYQAMQAYAQAEYCKKNNLKVPPTLEQLKQVLEKGQKKNSSIKKIVQSTGTSDPTRSQNEHNQQTNAKKEKLQLTKV